MKIEADIQNLKKFLVNDERFYQIPDYQRPYSWGKDNVSDLIDDLITAYINSKDDDYFCGSVVLVNNKIKDRFDIIDGQQRITTFIIIACVFRDVYGSELQDKATDFINQSIEDKYEHEKRKLTFLTAEQYQIDFEQTVLNKIDFKITKNIDKKFNDNKYLRNSHYIKDFLAEKIVDVEEKGDKFYMNNFVEWFFENIVLTVITCPSEDSAIQIFNVLNNRGMPLSPFDILKSSLMQKINGKDEKVDREAFKTKWEEINSRLKFANCDLDGMLSTYLYYKIATNPKNRIDKELLCVFDKEGTDSLRIVQEISNFSKKYIEALTEENKYLYCLRYLKHEIYWRAILATALFVEYRDISELKSLLVAYYYQHWVSGATVARIKQTSFNILKLVKDGNGIDKIKLEMQENLKKYSTTKTFKEAIEGDLVYGRKWDRAILLLIEYFSSDDSTQKYIKIERKLHLEHVLPQTLTEYWENIFNAAESEKWANSLANLTLLSMKKNIQAQNYSFENKIDVYQNKDNVVSSFVITKDVIDCDKWDVAELEKRKTKLLNKVMEKLDLFD